jgi:hypothetical protein
MSIIEGESRSSFATHVTLIRVQQSPLAGLLVRYASYYSGKLNIR